MVDYVPSEIKLPKTAKNIWRPKVTSFRETEVLVECVGVVYLD